MNFSPSALRCSVDVCVVYKLCVTCPCVVCHACSTDVYLCWRISQQQLHSWCVLKSTSLQSLREKCDISPTGMLGVAVAICWEEVWQLNDRGVAGQVCQCTMISRLYRLNPPDLWGMWRLGQGEGLQVSCGGELADA